MYDESLPKARSAKGVLLKIARGELAALTSTLTWDEVVRVVQRLLSRSDAVKQGRKLLAFPRLSFVGIDEDIIVRAQVLIERYELTPRDAIHVACALEAGEREVVSDDADLDRVGEIKRIPLV